MANITYNVASVGSSAYQLTNVSTGISGNNLSLSMNLGDTLIFNVIAPGHPFHVKTQAGTGTGNQASLVSNNGATNGTVTFIPQSAGTYYYQCSIHSSMVGTITVVDPDTTTDWTQLGQDIDGESSADSSGISVSFSGDGSRVAIGASGDDDAGGNAGHTRIYEYNGSAWVQIGQDIDGETAGDLSGGYVGSVRLSSDGRRVAIGAIHNDGGGTKSGHTRIYEYNGSAWVQLGSDIDGEAAGDQSGISVSLSSGGSRVAIGAYFNDGGGNNTGHTRVYEYNGSAWVQLGSDIDGEATSDYSGHSVSLSSDGSRIAIGAYMNDGGGTNSGHTRIYDYNGSAWVQKGSDIDGEATGDTSGWSVSLSSDGSRVAIGAPSNDDGGSSAGHVRVYKIEG